MRKRIIHTQTGYTFLEIEMETDDETSWKERVLQEKWRADVTLLDDDTMQVTSWWNEIKDQVSGQSFP